MVSLDAFSSAMFIFGLLKESDEYEEEYSNDEGWKHRWFDQLLLNKKRLHSVLGEDIAALLFRFRNESCGMLHDRVYSLHSLCLRSACVTVDHSQHQMKLAEEVLSILRHHCACATLF